MSAEPNNNMHLAAPMLSVVQRKNATYDHKIHPVNHAHHYRMS